MAEGIDIIDGFNLSKKRPLELRTSVPAQANRLAIKWLYKGLIVFQQDTGGRYMYTGNETSNTTDDWLFVRTLLSGSGAPANTLGYLGDFYIRDGGQVYRKDNPTLWTLLFTITGSQIFTGVTDPPDDGVGNNGDIYYVSIGGVVKLYRKQSGTWVYQFNVNGTNGTSTYLYVAYATAIDGTGYILVASNDGTAVLTPPDVTKKFIAFLATDTPIGGSITQANFTGLWGPFGGDGNRWSTTSITSLTIGTGSKSFTIETELAWVTGQRFVLATPGDPNTRMEGDTISYNPTTGAFVGNVTVTSGSGTFSSWVLSLQASAPDATDIPFSNTDVDTGTEPVDTVTLASAKKVIWDYKATKGSNAGGGRVTVVVNGSNISASHTPDEDIGTVDVVPDISLSGGNIVLSMIATSDDWIVKGRRRIISD